MKRAVFLSVLLFVLAFTVNAVIPAGMVIFNVTDMEGNALEGVEIILHSKKLESFEEKLTTDEKGHAKILLKLGDYEVEFHKEGFAPMKQVIKPSMGERKELDVKLGSIGQAMAQMDDAGELTGKDKAVVLFNEAVPMIKAGDDDGALPKLEEAIQEDPELAPALFHAGRIHLMKNDLEKAEAELLKVLEVKPDMDSVYPLLAETYKRMGDDKNYEKYLAEAETRGTVSAGEYYNQAAEKINAGDDTGAKPLLEKAISINPEFADAYYELGMLYLRTGDTQKCVDNLNKYLEYKPDGPNAQVCKDLIQSLGSM